MKFVTCVVRPENLAAIANPLDKMHVAGTMVSDVRGEEYRGRFLPKIQPDLVLQDEYAGPVLNSIGEITRTGRVGDRKVFVTNVLQVMRGRIGEKGTSAL
jgi:nitrogen regulatory protein PII